MNILVLEDEQRAGEKLLDLIKATAGPAQLHWERSVAGGIQHLQTQAAPDLIFSDIELLDGNVFDLYRQVSITCPIIFCTAYDRFYINAFQTNGIAYLLKPYTKAQFLEAWEKYQRLFNTSSPSLSPQLLQDLQLLLHKEGQASKTVFSVKKSDGIFLLKTANILYFQAQGDFVTAIDIHQKKHILNQSLSSIEAALSAKQFFRINRSEIIPLQYIQKYNTYFKNKLVIHLQGTTDVLYTSSSRTPAFRKWLED